MKIIDKIKNFFYDEEEVIIPDSLTKKEEIKKEENTKDESKKEETEINVDEVISERELFKSDPTFKFPIIFEDDDFVEEKRKNQSMNVLDVENNKRKEIKEISKKFEPSPIISPIYGVLDKNYKKEEISNKKNDIIYIKNEQEKIDLDSVIKKAYGNYKKLDEMENKNNKKENQKIKDKVIDTTIDLFKNIDDEEQTEEENNEETNINFDVDIEFENNYNFSSKEEKDKNIDDLLEKTNEHDFYSLVDSMYKDENEEELKRDGNVE